MKNEKVKTKAMALVVAVAVIMAAFSGTVNGAILSPETDIYVKVWETTLDLKTYVVTTGDQDQDGKREIITGESANNGKVKVFENTGDNNYQRVWNSGSLGVHVYDLATGDADDDSKPEIVASLARSVNVYENTGDNTYEQVWRVRMPNQCNGVVIGDQDGDGAKEIIFGEDGNKKVHVYENTADDSYSEVWNSGSIFTDRVGRITIGDLDDDGAQEIIVAGSGKVYVFENTIDNTYTKVWDSGAVLTNPWSVVVGDQDEDGAKEIIASSGDKKVYVFENAGDDTYLKVWDSGTVITETVNSLALGDQDDDGRREIIVASLDNKVRVFENTGDNAYHEAWNSGTVLSDSPRALTVGDQDADGKKEIIIGTRIDNVGIVYVFENIPIVSPTENHPPTATRIEPASKEVNSDFGGMITFKVKAEDEDEDVHNNLHMIQWLIDDEWIVTDSADGTSEEVSFTYTFENRGTFSVRATVYDEQMEEDSVTWEVNVMEKEPEGLIEEEILDNDGNEIGLKVRIEYSAILSQGQLGWIDIKLKTKDFEDATYPDSETNLRRGYIMIASDEDMYVDAGGVVHEVAPAPQSLHREAFGWEDYEKFLRQEKNEWGMMALERILAGLRGASQVSWLEETLNWNPLGEIKYDIGEEPLHTSFYDKNNHDVWEYPWNFNLFSISKKGDERRGNGVHLRMPFVYEKAGKHELLVFLLVEDYDSYGYEPFDKAYTIGKEYKCDIDVGGNKMSGITSEKTEIPLEEEKGIPGFEVVFAIAGLLASAYLLRRKG